MKAATARPDRAAPLYETIYAVLREHIADRTFPHGLVLGESVVARAFGSSRIPAAAALQRLRDDGLLRDFNGRGYLVGKGDAQPLRLELAAAGLRLPKVVAEDLKTRNHRWRIYPDIEHAVSQCLSYGRFLLNETALAEQYQVSRTIAHEVLTRLERSGLISQDANQRWYAGPLTPERLREHFEIRWLLEPAALGQAMAVIDPDEIAAKRIRATQARKGVHAASQLERLEMDLHVDVVLKCANGQLRETIQRSQLLLIPTHSTFEALQDPQEIETMLAEHIEIFDYVIAGQRRKAMAALESHVRRSVEPNVERLMHLGPLPERLRPPFLVPVDTAERSRRGAGQRRATSGR